MVVYRNQPVEPDRDYAFGKATWDLQATPVFEGVLLVLGIVALGGLVRQLVTRLKRSRGR